MAKMGNRQSVPVVVKVDLAKAYQVARRVEHLDTPNPGLSCILKPQMQVLGSFKRVKGLLGKPTKIRVDDILKMLETFPKGAEFVGVHAGRRVVGRKDRFATLVFADSYSEFLPTLPDTCF